MYRDSAGKITATSGQGRRPMAIVGFNELPGGKRDLTQPSVRPLDAEGVKSIEVEAAVQGVSPPELPTTHLQETGNWCRKCGSRQSTRWRTGPDGLKTLCTSCSHRYSRMGIVLYRNAESPVSALARPGWQPVAITGFKKANNGQTRDLRAPVVRAMSAEEVARSADTCLEYVPPLEASQHVYRPSVAQNSPPNSVAGMLGDSIPVQTGASIGLQKSNVLITSRGSQETAEKFSAGRRIEAANAKRETDGVDLKLHSSEIGQNVLGAISIKAAFKTKEGVILVRRSTVENGTSFHRFLNQLRNMFNIEDALNVSYEDDEGDEVTVSSSVELLVMLAIAKEQGISPVRVTVVSK